MGYSRKIAYLDLLNHGQKKGNAGFCKWEQRNDRHVLAVLVNGLPRNISCDAGIYNGQGTQLANIKILEGRGESLCHLQEGHNWDEELDFVHIRFPEGIELVAEFQREHTDSVLAEIPINKQEEILSEPQAEVPIETIAVLEPVVKAEQSQTKVLFWNKLLSSHEKIHPFGTQEEYCRVALEDIYRLKEEYHVLRNNQFLLHGYYNYHYLILGKKKGEECVYWLGVPGIYHEREKMAARMYGFEKFEGAKPGYRTGDLGYYLITTESDRWINEDE